MSAVTPIVEPGITNGTANAGLRGLLRRPLAVAALIVLAVIVVACVLAPVLTPYQPLSQNLNAVMQLPSAKHILGTDTLGRDVYTRILFGGRPALLGALEAMVVFGVIGIILGLIAGYSRDAVDRVISVFVDLLMSLPGIVVMFAVLALFNNNLGAAMVTLGLFSSGGLVRVVRAATKATREELYVAAARVSGLGSMRILLRHIAPKLVGPIVIQVSLFAGIALVVQSGLGFLNLGVVAPAPSWGGMVGEASQVISQSPWLLVPSGGIIGITVLALGIIGDAVRDINAETKSRSGGITRKRALAPKATAATAPADGDALLVVDGLRIAFDTPRGESEVVHGISFSVRRGELIGLVGESGSGKTVTALSLLGLLPPNAAITSNRTVFDGREFTSLSKEELHQLRGAGIGLISQEPMVALDPSFTVGQQLREVIRAHGGISRADAHRKAISLLEDVRLPEPESVARRYPHELSGGMAQRVVIALSLAGEPKLLLADEPTTALDVTVQAEILDLLRALRDERGMAILLVTHDLGVVADFCERAVVMQHGRIVESKDIDQLFGAPEHEYTRALIAATPSLIDLTDVEAQNVEVASNAR
ncbi:dipeptide/oligopeptide/nickel ABC transporter permease/ATP-binding protein [Gryllotalpicola koreensis]|uniref:Dipeptide/oligopeptide/nickel ABC transporter permease/ATP-binding protein n=1 Tax=Gryllotalpicola koreensis TaxID=993086 RepID=A0ABP7ZQN9_9MICO